MLNQVEIVVAVGLPDLSVVAGLGEDTAPALEVYIDFDLLDDIAVYFANLQIFCHLFYSYIFLL